MSSNENNAKNHIWHPFLSRTHTYITYEELYDETPKHSEIIDLIKSLPVDYWIKVASMGRIFLDHYGESIDHQAILIDAFLPDSLLQKEVPIDDYIFHKTQMSAILRLALVYSPTSMVSNTTEEQKKEITSRCMLGISSLLYNMDEYNEEEPSFDSKLLLNKLSFLSRPKLLIENENFIMNILRICHNHHGEYLKYVMGRYKDMLFDIPIDPNCQ